MADTIIQFVDQYGYVIFFLAFCLGPFGIPVPNEITILTGSMLSAAGTLNPWIVYFSMLVGLIIAITAAYTGGRFLGGKFRAKLLENRHYIRTEHLFRRYGNFAMCIAFLIPIVRYAMPVFAGINHVSYKRFAIISYLGALLWTLLFFTSGHRIMNWISVISPEVLLLILLFIVSTVTYGITKKYYEWIQHL